jgi:hypothetical protein
MPASNSVSYRHRTALLEIVRLNAISFSNPTALYVNIASNTIQKIHVLIDSGSSDCFIDSHFAIEHKLLIQDLMTLLQLTLFDGSATTSGLIRQFT